MKRVSHVLNYKGSYYDIDHYYINQFGYNNFFILYATINKFFALHLSSGTK